MMAGPTSTWIWIALAVVLSVSGFLLPIAALVYLVLDRRRSPTAKVEKVPRPKRPKSLVRLLEDGLAQLGSEARRLPIVLVLGERCSGKTSLLDALLRSEGSDARQTETIDRRVSVRAGRDVVFVELAGGVFDDGSAVARRQIEELLAAIALRTTLVLLVVDAQAPSYDPVALGELGRNVRELIDGLASRRSTPLSLRVCLTHLDEAEPGFVQLGCLLGAEHWQGTQVRTSRQGPVLAGLLHDYFRKAPLLETALVALSPADVERLRALQARGTSTRLGWLEGLYLALHGSNTASALRDEPLVLGALRAGERPLLLGDPLKLAPTAVAMDLQRFDQRRFQRGLAWGVALAFLVVGLYGWQLYRLRHAAHEVSAFLQRRGPISDESNLAAARAGESLRDALMPLWLPLRYAFPRLRAVLDAPPANEPGSSEARASRARPTDSGGDASPAWKVARSPLGGSRERFLSALRERYLSLDDGHDYPTTLHAVALLRSSRHSQLGRYVLEHAEEFATLLRLPLAVVTDYVSLSQSAWLGPIAIGGSEVERGAWAPVVSVLKSERGTVDAATLEQVRDNACRLRASRSTGEADEVQLSLEAYLETESPNDARVLRVRDVQDAPPQGLGGPKELEQLLSSICDTKLARWTSGGSLLDVVAQLRRLKNASPSNEGNSRADERCVLTEGSGAGALSRWQQLSKRSLATSLVVEFMSDVTGGKPPRSPFFSRSHQFTELGLGSQGLGATVGLSERYTMAVAKELVGAALVDAQSAIGDACVDTAESENMRSLLRGALEQYARDYVQAQQAYYRSFQFQFANLASFRLDYAGLLSPGAWFDRFWSVLTENAQPELSKNPELEPLAKALTPFDTLKALKKEGKLDLTKYSEVMRPYLAVLEEKPLAEAGPTLGERLSPLGKQGLAFLDPKASLPLQQVDTLLDSLGLARELRTPLLKPAQYVQSLAVGSLENTVSEIYAKELHPLASALWDKFPFAPLGKRDASPDDVLVQLGGKGILRTAFVSYILPVVTHSSTGAYLPARVGNASLRLPQGILSLGRWLDSVGSLLFDDAGQPKPLLLMLRADPLLRFEPGDKMAATNAYVSAGSEKVVAFNQAPGWQKLSVPWLSSVPAEVGVSLHGQQSSESLDRTRPASGENWQILHLLCDADSLTPDRVSWNFGPVEVAFQIEAIPFERLVAPGMSPSCIPQIIEKGSSDGPIVVNAGPH